LEVFEKAVILIPIFSLNAQNNTVHPVDIWGRLLQVENYSMLMEVIHSVKYPGLGQVTMFVYENASFLVMLDCSDQIII
jgi:hypothetical protein